MDSVKIRKIEGKDFEEVRDVSVASFSDTIACRLTVKGISTFSEIAESNIFFNRMKEVNIIHVAEKANKAEGVIENSEGLV